MNHVLHGHRHRIGNVGCLLRVTVFRGNVHERGVRRIGDSQLLGQTLHRSIQSKILDDRLKYGFGGCQRCIRRDLASDVRATRVLLANARIIPLGSIVRSHSLSRGGILRRNQEGVRSHPGENHHKYDGSGDQMLANDTHQIHQRDAVFRIICNDNLLDVSVLCGSH